MKTKLSKLLLSIVTILSLGATFYTPAVLAADRDGRGDICELKDANGNYVVSEEVRAASGCPGTGANITIQDVITNILYIVISMSSIVAVVFIVIGGVGYMTSAGDSGKLKKAKDTILYSVIGLVICALSFAIVNFTSSIINRSGIDPSTMNGDQASCEATGFTYDIATSQCR